MHAFASEAVRRRCSLPSGRKANAVIETSPRLPGDSPLAFVASTEVVGLLEAA
jgi:hypothetical protein